MDEKKNILDNTAEGEQTQFQSAPFPSVETGRERSGSDEMRDSTSVANKYVYQFSEGNAEMKNLLGGKGANLCEMTGLGFPVPPGFVISTEACIAYLDQRDYPPGLPGEIEKNLSELEERTGKKLGDTKDPLLVSVRSGARISMPGMMDTVFNL